MPIETGPGFNPESTPQEQEETSEDNLNTDFETEHITPKTPAKEKLNQYKEVTEQEKKEEELYEEFAQDSAMQFMMYLGDKHAIKSGFSRAGGWQELTDHRAQGYSKRLTNRNPQPKELLKNHKINEQLLILPQQMESVTEPEEYEEEIIERKFLFLKDIKKVKKVRHIKTGERPRQHSSLIDDGKEESAVELQYIAQNNGGEETDWIDYDSKRPGGMLRVDMILPESLAKKIISQTQEHPEFIRKIINKKIRTLLKIDEQEWNGEASNQTPIHPPYKKWNTHGFNKLYIGKINEEFNPDNIVEYGDKTPQ